MMTLQFPSICFLLLASVSTTTALAPKWNELDETYSFEQYQTDFGKGYESPQDYDDSENVFRENLSRILEHNHEYLQGTHKHVLGVNHFTDVPEKELPTGYIKPSASAGTTAEARRLKINDLPFAVDAVSALPESVDWRKQGVTTPIKNQGGCGSCWAFASTAVLEAHIAIETGILYELSEQEVVSCATNPNHCGGTGGCTGSTAEIAYEFIREHGAVEEWAFGYQSFHGKDIECSLLDDPTSPDAALRGVQPVQGNLKNAVASIRGYAVLPSNDYTVVMNAVAKLGPLAVSVACLPWQLYEGGVFYAPMDDQKSADVDHLVVLEGYGTDEDTQEDYWLVRNSWGPRWGEGGERS